MFSDFKNPTLRKKYPYLELFWSAFSRIFPHTGKWEKCGPEIGYLTNILQRWSAYIIRIDLSGSSSSHSSRQLNVPNQ